MSILTDTYLKQIICAREEQLDDTKIFISNYQEDSLTPMGYDLKVGGYYRTYGSSQGLTLIKQGEKIVIKPGDTALIATLEEIKMPRNGSVSALIVSKVSQVVRGLSNISTKIDPNWQEGSLLIAVHNFSRDSIELKYSEKICSVVFYENKVSSRTPPRGSKIDRFNIASSQGAKLKRVMFKYLPIIIVLIIPAFIYWLFGKSVIFDASIPISVAISQLLSKTFE